MLARIALIEIDDIILEMGLDDGLANLASGLLALEHLLVMHAEAFADFESHEGNSLRGKRGRSRNFDCCESTGSEPGCEAVGHHGEGGRMAKADIDRLEDAHE